MDKCLVSTQERLRCRQCGWEGRISELKKENAELLEETWFHECPSCGVPLVMETETQAYLSKDARSLETGH